MAFPRLSAAFAALSLAALSLTALAVTAHAAPADTSAEVIVGGTLIHTVRTSWAGHSPQQRAAQVQQRLNTLLGQGPVSPGDITVGRVQDDWCVLFRGQRFLTADLPAARLNHCSPSALAGMWAKYLRQVLPDLTKPPHR